MAEDVATHTAVVLAVEQAEVHLAHYAMCHHLVLHPL